MSNSSRHSLVIGGSNPRLGIYKYGRIYQILLAVDNRREVSGLNPGKGHFSENKYDERENTNKSVPKISKNELAGLTSRNVSFHMKG